MDRFQQLMLRSKQSGSNAVLRRVPNLSDLTDGVPVFAFTGSGLAEYVKYNNVMYKSDLNKVTGSTSKTRILRPDYDSGWSTVTYGSNTTHYDFTHNLNSKMLLTQCYLKDTANSNLIFNISTNFTDTIYDTTDTALIFYHETVNNIAVCTGNNYIFSYDNTPISDTGVQLTSADIRILAWKTGVGE